VIPSTDLAERAALDAGEFLHIADKLAIKPRLNAVVVDNEMNRVFDQPRTIALIFGGFGKVARTRCRSSAE
jgi:hypothetical protein